MAAISTEKILLYSVGGLAAYNFILKPILEGLNLKDTAEEKAKEKLQTETENLPVNSDYWKPSYYKQVLGGKRSMIFTQASADNLCKRLMGAQGTFNDNETVIYGVFRQCNYKSQVSFLAERFFILYRKDLYTWLKEDVLNQTELNIVLNITSKLPTGFIVK